MKLLKQTTVAVALLATGLVSAQSNNYTNMLKVGLNAGVSLPMENAVASAGVDVAFQHLVTPSIGLGVASGYTHFFGRDNDIENNITLENNDFGVVPVAALFRFYPKKTGFFVGTNLGYGFITGNGDVTDNYTTDRPEGGLYIKPEIGYHNTSWNFSIQYQKVFTGDDGEMGSQNYNAGSLGLAVGYNIPLGK